jgi:AbiV family abortive infection protein
MKVKAIRQLSSLNDEDLFIFISEGLSKIAENVAKIELGSTDLTKAGNTRAARILRAISEEEAAKFLILMDVVRCPRQPSEIFSRQLGYFYDHIAKGIYAQSCYWRCVEFGEVEQLIELFRPDLYLDGPNDVDWIFPNEIKYKRESCLYVDCAADDAGNLKWTTPFPIDETHIIGLRTSMTVKLMYSLLREGFAKVESLKLISKRWRLVKFDNYYDYPMLKHDINGTINDLKEARLLINESDDYQSFIGEGWFFPLWGFDLKEIRVNEKDLREKQKKLDYW